MGDNVSLIRSIINIVVGSILAAVIFMIIKKVTDVTGTYSPALVFFITLFVILLLLGIKTFASFIKNILVTLLTIIIGFVLLMLVIFVLDSFVDLPALLGRLDNPLAFTNTTLVIGSTILLTIIYHMTTRLGWITSFFRSFISVIVSIVLVLLLQNLFGLAGMLWSVVIFHVFLAIFLFIIGLRGTDHRFIYGAQVGRVAFIHFVIMFVLFLVLRAVIG